jgi:hypothetical protein
LKAATKLAIAELASAHNNTLPGFDPSAVTKVNLTPP